MFKRVYLPPMAKMKLSHFAYKLPESQIAQYPADYRDDSRMMVVHRETGNIEHKHFRDLVDYFNPCLLYTSPSPRDVEESRMPSSA